MSGPTITVYPNMEATASSEEVVTTGFNEEVIEPPLTFTQPTMTYADTPNNLTDFFESPLVTNQVAWSTGQAALTVLAHINYRDLFTTDFTTKMRGRNLLNARFNLRVMINAMPFHAGRLRVVFVPGKFATGIQSKIDTYTHFLSQITQLPGFEMDAKVPSMEFSMPFISPHNYIDYASDGAGIFSSSNFGTYYIVILSPLTVGSTGSTTVDVTVMSWYDQIKLCAPLIGNANMKGALQDKEREAVASGSVSKGLRAVSTFAGALSTIPALAAYCAPVMWASDRLAGVASAFGYANPITDTPTMVVSNQYNRHFANSDGDDTSFTAALLRNNEVQMLQDITFRKEDEMSWNFLKSVSAITRHFSWDTSTAIGTNIQNFKIGPNNLIEISNITQGGGHVATIQSGPPFTYLAPQFKYWRGSIVLTLKIVKTQFHSGRLCVVYNPTVNFDFTSLTLNNTQYMMREFIDLRYEDTATFVLPYLNSYDWLLYDEWMGTFKVYIVNQLVAPATVAQIVDILVEIKAGDDFELAAPTLDAIPGIPTMVGNADDRGSSTDVGDLSVVRTNIGGSKIGSHNLYPHVRCIGESFTSVKQLTSRLTQIDTLSTVLHNPIITPWLWPMTSTNSGIIASGMGGDAFCLIAPMYAFARGSFKVAASEPPNATSEFFKEKSYWLQVAGSHVVTDSTSSPTNFPWYTGGRTFAYGIGKSSEQVVSVLVPYYNNYKLTALEWDTTALLSNAPLSVPTVGVVIATYNNPHIYRATADDFQFGYFLTAPPLMLGLT